jgi:hypothetical protein
MCRRSLSQRLPAPNPLLLIWRFAFLRVDSRLPCSFRTAQRHLREPMHVLHPTCFLWSLFCCLIKRHPVSTGFCWRHATKGGLAKLDASGLDPFGSILSDCGWRPTIGKGLCDARGGHGRHARVRIALEPLPCCTAESSQAARIFPEASGRNGAQKSQDFSRLLRSLRSFAAIAWRSLVAASPLWASLRQLVRRLAVRGRLAARATAPKIAESGPRT